MQEAVWAPLVRMARRVSGCDTSSQPQEGEDAPHETTALLAANVRTYFNDALSQQEGPTIRRRGKRLL
jgi:hypothetical protein